MSEYLLSIEQRKRVVALALVTALGAGACGGAAEGAEDGAMDYVPSTTVEQVTDTLPGMAEPQEVVDLPDSPEIEIPIPESAEAIMASEETVQIIQDIMGRRDEALATGNKELLATVYANPPVEGSSTSRHWTDIEFINAIASEYGTEDYGNEYSFTNVATLFPDSVMEYPTDDETRNVSYLMYTDIGKTVYRFKEILVPGNVEGQYMVEKSATEELGNFYDICDNLSSCLPAEDILASS